MLNYFRVFSVQTNQRPTIKGRSPARPSTAATRVHVRRVTATVHRQFTVGGRDCVASRATSLPVCTPDICCANERKKLRHTRSSPAYVTARTARRMTQTYAGWVHTYFPRPHKSRRASVAVTASVRACSLLALAASQTASAARCS